MVRSHLLSCVNVFLYSVALEHGLCVHNDVCSLYVYISFSRPHRIAQDWIMSVTCHRVKLAEHFFPFFAQVLFFIYKSLTFVDATTRKTLWSRRNEWQICQKLGNELHVCTFQQQPSMQQVVQNDEKHKPVSSRKVYIQAFFKKNEKPNLFRQAGKNSPRNEHWASFAQDAEENYILRCSI